MPGVRQRGKGLAKSRRKQMTEQLAELLQISLEDAKDKLKDAQWNLESVILIESQSPQRGIGKDKFPQSCGATSAGGLAFPDEVDPLLQEALRRSREDMGGTS